MDTICVVPAFPRVEYQEPHARCPRRARRAGRNRAHDLHTTGACSTIHRFCRNRSTGEKRSSPAFAGKISNCTSAKWKARQARSPSSPGRRRRRTHDPVAARSAAARTRPRRCDAISSSARAFSTSTGAILPQLFRRHDGRAKPALPVVIDIDELYDESTHELLKLVDYLIASSDFADDPRELADRYGCPVVGITRGAEGCRVCRSRPPADPFTWFQSSMLPIPPAPATSFTAVLSTEFCKLGSGRRHPLRKRRGRDEMHADRRAPRYSNAGTGAGISETGAA